MKKILTLSIVLLSFFSFSQNTGLYGKRNYIEFNMLGNVPLFNYWINRGKYERYYKKMSSNSNSLTNGKNILNYGFRVSLGHAGKKRTGLGVEIGYDFIKMAGPSAGRYNYINQWDNSSYAFIDVKHEAVSVRTLSIIPKIEFTSKGGNLPVGINHQIGLGITTSNIVEKDYVMKVDPYEADYYFQSSADSSQFVNNFIDYDVKYGGFTFLYNFNIKTPISKKIMVNYGIRYTLHLRKWYDDYNYFDAPWSSNEISSQIGSNRITNFLTFNLGIGYSF